MLSERSLVAKRSNRQTPGACAPQLAWAQRQWQTSARAEGTAQLIIQAEPASQVGLILVLAAMSDFFTSSNSLAVLAAALLVAYLVLFARLLARYPNDSAILRSDRTGKRSNLLVIPLVIAAVLAPMPYKAIALCVALPLLIGLAWAQHLRLAKAGASLAFLRRLAALSVPAVGAMVAFVFAAGS